MQYREPYVLNNLISREIGACIIKRVVETIPSRDGVRIENFGFWIQEQIKQQILDPSDRIIVSHSATRTLRHCTERMGAERKRTFIREALRWLTPEQFAAAYLEAFPPELTTGERDAMSRFLLHRVGVPRDAVKIGLARFATRPSRERRHECYLFPSSTW